MPPVLTMVSVLVVDDDRDIREILTEILIDAGYSVVGSSNGAEAIELLKTIKPELILLDLNMPVMDGRQFREMQQRDPAIASIPTVVMSAVDRMKERMADLVVDGALEKPVELKELLRVVASHCASPKRP